MIDYQVSIEDITSERLGGFFVGWPDPPSSQVHLKILTNSDEIVLAVDRGTGNVVGFVTAVTDGILSAYIPLLEVLPEYQNRGIGRELVRRVLEKLGDIYMIDLTCDPGLQPFYERFGMKTSTGMMLRNYQRQSGE